MSGDWSQASINTDMAAFIGRYVWDIPTTSSGTVTTDFIYRATTEYSWALYHTKTVRKMYIDHNGHIMRWLTMMDSQRSLTLRWHSMSTWGRECFTSSFSYNGGHYFRYDCLQHDTPQSTQDTQPTIVDAPLTFIFKMGKGGYRNLFHL